MATKSKRAILSVQCRPFIKMKKCTNQKDGERKHSVLEKKDCKEITRKIVSYNYRTNLKHLSQIYYNRKLHINRNESGCKKNCVGEFINLKPCKLQKIRIISPFAVGRPLHMAVSSMTLQVREYIIQSDNHSSARPHIAASPYICVGSLLSLTLRLDLNIMGSAL